MDLGSCKGFGEGPMMVKDDGHWIQIGVLPGGVGKCTKNDSSTMFLRLNFIEVLQFVKCPETYTANRTCKYIYGKYTFLSLKMMINQNQLSNTRNMVLQAI